MKKIIILGVISSLLVSNIMAAEKSIYGQATNVYDTYFGGAKIAASLDKENTILPDLYLPIHWSQQLSTSIEYRKIQEIENDHVAGYDTSEKKTTLDSTTINLQVLKYHINYENSSYSVGAGYSNDIFDKNQKGFATNSSETINYNHDVNIDISGISIFANAIYNKITDDLSAKFSLLLLAASTLDVTQNTVLNGTSTGKGSSSEDLDLIYEIRAEFNYELTSFLDLGFETRYKFLPMKYSVELAQLDNTFFTEKFEVDEKIYYNAISLYFKTEFLNGFRPMVGYISEKTDGANKLNNTNYSNTENMFTFGLNSKF